MKKQSSKFLEALRPLRNFINEYSENESEKNLDLIYKTLKDPSLMDDSSNREQLLSYLESLEEVIPAVYKLDLKELNVNFN